MFFYLVNFVFTTNRSKNLKRNYNKYKLGKSKSAKLRNNGVYTDENSNVIYSSDNFNFTLFDYVISELLVGFYFKFDAFTTIYFRYPVRYYHDKLFKLRICEFLANDISTRVYYDLDFLYNIFFIHVINNEITIREKNVSLRYNKLWNTCSKIGEIVFNQEIKSKLHFNTISTT